MPELLTTFLVIVIVICLLGFVLSLLICFNYRIRPEYSSYKLWHSVDYDCYKFHYIGEKYHATLFHCEYPLLGRIAACYDRKGDRLVFRTWHMKGQCSK